MLASTTRAFKVLNDPNSAATNVTQQLQQLVCFLPCQAKPTAEQVEFYCKHHSFICLLIWDKVFANWLSLMTKSDMAACIDCFLTPFPLQAIHAASTVLKQLSSMENVHVHVAQICEKLEQVLFQTELLQNMHKECEMHASQVSTFVASLVSLPDVISNASKGKFNKKVFLHECVTIISYKW